MQKNSILGILYQNSPFWIVFGQNGRNRIFFKKALGTFFLRLWVLTNCKVSEKSNERIRRKRFADKQTDEGLMDGSYDDSSTNQLINFIHKIKKG